MGKNKDKRNFLDEEKEIEILPTYLSFYSINLKNIKNGQ